MGSRRGSSCRPCGADRRWRGGVNFATTWLPGLASVRGPAAWDRPCRDHVTGSGLSNFTERKQLTSFRAAEGVPCHIGGVLHVTAMTGRDGLM